MIFFILFLLEDKVTFRVHTDTAKHLVLSLISFFINATFSLCKWFSFVSGRYYSFERFRFISTMNQFYRKLLLLKNIYER